MRTNELLRRYLSGAEKEPQTGWMKLVWHAAGLVRIATEMRNTRRERRDRGAAKGRFTQEELFK